MDTKRKGDERMTKRFTIEQTTIKECIVDNTTGEQLDTFDYTERLCEVLNALHEENQELRLQLNQCSDQRNEFHRMVRENVNRVGKLEKENEQLKTKNNAYLQDIEMFKEENTTLKLENQELHKLNQEYINNLSDEKKETLSEMLNAILGDDGK